MTICRQTKKRRQAKKGRKNRRRKKKKEEEEAVSVVEMEREYCFRKFGQYPRLWEEETWSALHLTKMPLSQSDQIKTHTCHVSSFIHSLIGHFLLIATLYKFRFRVSLRVPFLWAFSEFEWVWSASFLSHWPDNSTQVLSLGSTLILSLSFSLSLCMGVWLCPELSTIERNK